MSLGPEWMEGSESSSSIQNLDSAVREEEPNTDHMGGTSQQEKQPDWAYLMPKIFEGTAKEQIEGIGRYWAGQKHEGRYPSCADGDGETFTIVPKVPDLPPHLVPWEGLLSDWGKKTKAGLDRRKLPSSLRDTALWNVAGPKLPDGAEPWVISLGVDSGPVRGEMGFTSLLLVAAPSNWSPGSKEVAFFGPGGEMLLHRCDGTTMRIPEEWWDRWAYGAMACGALYFVLG